MRILGKTGDEFEVLANPSEEIQLGAYILAEENGKRLLLQIFDERYSDIQGLQDDIIQEEVIRSSSRGVEFDPMGMKGISDLIRDMRILRCKVRLCSSKGIVGDGRGSIPSRVSSEVRRMTLSEVFGLVGRTGSREITIGRANGDESKIYAEDLDGSLNIITGKKGSGKSHLAKIIVRGLAEHGANIVVFDLNDEYRGMALMHDGQKSSLDKKLLPLKPAETLKFTLGYLGLRAVLGILQHVLDIPGASLREFNRIWQKLEETNSLKISSIVEAVMSWRCNEFVRDALLSRIYSLESTGIFTEYEEHAIRFEELFTDKSGGRIVVVSLANVSSLVRRVVVELILGKLTNLLEGGLITPVFLFAEEAHLYLRETYWDDLVTRMRHFGLFPTLITNQPDAIETSIYRQADNIFLFNFTSDLDLEMISRASTTDSASIKSMVRNLPRGGCMILGKVVRGLPVLVDVPDSDMITLGETKLFFRGRGSRLDEWQPIQVDHLAP